VHIFHNLYSSSANLEKLDLLNRFQSGVERIVGNTIEAAQVKVAIAGLCAVCGPRGTPVCTHTTVTSVYAGRRDFTTLSDSTVIIGACGGQHQCAVVNFYTWEGLQDFANCSSCE
jgi:hypothetical protein